MLDSLIRPLIDPPLNKFSQRFSAAPFGPNVITVIGFLFGVVACITVMLQMYSLAFVFVILNRLSDGLDGAYARSKNKTSDFGGYLDIVLDYLFYAGFPLAAAIGINTISSVTAGAFILFSFIGTAVTFLAYAIICAKRGLETNHQGQKSFYFSKGLMEGTETIIFLMLICVMPAYFVPICIIFGLLCCLTTLQRIRMVMIAFQ